jgi:4-hydroxy-tetrahydrodipicolinate synthase
MINLNGLGVAMITPFNKNGAVDYPALQRNTEHLINSDVEFLVVLGTTAETPTLSLEEQRSVLDFIIELNNKRLPIVVGLAGNNTQALCDRISDFNFKGIDAVLSASPHYNKPSQRGIVEHFTKVAEASPKPIILYNVPSRTGSNMTSATTLELANHKNVMAIKEASGDLQQVDEILKGRPKGFQVFSGDDALTLAMLSSGADGVISVIGNALPKRFGSMVNQALFGQVIEAREMHHKLSPIITSIFEEGNPAGIKSVMDMIGLCDDSVRLPLVSATKQLRDKLYSCLADLDVEIE